MSSTTSMPAGMAGLISTEPIAVAIGSAMAGLISGKLWRLRPARARAIARRSIACARRAEDGHRLGRVNFDFLETLDVLAIERVAEGAFQPRQVDAFVLRDQADRLARLAHPGGAADAMDVAVGLVGQIEVDDVRNVGDVESAGGHVGRDHHAKLSRAEARHRRIALA